MKIFVVTSASRVLGAFESLDRAKSFVFADVLDDEDIHEEWDVLDAHPLKLFLSYSPGCDCGYASRPSAVKLVLISETELR